MARITITASIARAAGQDAGNRHARRNGRTTWNEADWNHAAAVTTRLMSIA